MPKVLVLQHHPAETLGIYAQVLTQFSVEVQIVHGYDGEAIPQRMRGFDGLVVMGGPAGVYEQTQFPYLADELRLIDRAMKSDSPVFGVCLGSQLLAAALGASVHRNEIGPEIGWHDVLLSELAAADSVWSTVHAEQQGQFSAFHWHGDVFDVPDGAVPLAHSEKTACQAFVYGRAIYGTLFHMEIDEHQIREMADLFAADVVATQQTSASLLKDATTRLPTVNGLGRVVFSNWLSLVLAASERRAP